MAGLNKGENHYKWKGGITPIAETLRTHSKMNNWTKKVYRRDQYKCTNCGSEESLNAHHIIHLADLINSYNIKTIEDANKFPIMWDISNGTTLCESCHVEIHNITRRLLSAS